MGRECGIVSPEEAAQSAEGRVELTRELFDSRMRNVAFGSWEDLVATLADKPTKQGYLGRHGDSGSVIRLDPTRIFGWTALLLINLCIWGLVGFFSTQSTVLGLALTIAYGLALWGVIQKALVPQLAGVLWPLIPTTVAAVGVLLQVLLNKDLGIGNSSTRLQCLLMLALAVLPHTAVAGFLLKDVQRDPDRATLVMNMMAGTFAAAMALYTLATGGDDDGDVFYFVGNGVMFLIGLACVVMALKLFVNPGEWGSIELVSWTLNLGTLAIFISSHGLLGVPECAQTWPWLVYLLVTIGIGVLGAVSGRSFSLLLTCVGLLFLSGRLAWAVSSVASGDISWAVFYTSFGLLGMAIIGVGQWLQQSAWWAKVSVEIRCALARAFGSQDLPYSWSHTAQAPLGPSSAS